MDLGRDWRAHYFANHGYWSIDASYADDPSEDPSDRYSLFDGIDDNDEGIHRLIAAAPRLQVACEAVEGAMNEPDPTRREAALSHALDLVTSALAEVRLRTGGAP